MADFIEVPGVIQLQAVYRVVGQTCENVFHCKHTGSIGATELFALTAVVRNWWHTVEKAAHEADVSLVKVMATDLTTQTSLGVEEPATSPSTGTAVGSVTMPNNVTVAVKWLTGLRGRSFRGRTYHVGIRAIQTSGQEITTSMQTLLASNYTTLWTSLNATGDVMGVVSRFHDKAPRVTGVFTPITGLSIDLTLDSQRRRLPGRGN